MTILAKFDGKVFVPVDPVDLPAGRVVEIDVKDMPQMRLLSGQEIVEALDRFPKVPADDVAELERLIESGMEPAKFEGIFDHLIESPEDESKD